MNFFVLYDAESALKKRKPRAKGVGSFAQYQSVKKRKAEALQRLQRYPANRDVRSTSSCLGCSVVLASSPQNGNPVKQRLCIRCEQQITDGLAERARVLGRGSIGRAESMDPFQSGAVKNDRVMDWVQQYYLLDIWPGIWPFAASRARYLTIYDWIVPQFRDNATTVHVRLFVGSSFMSVEKEFAKLHLTPAHIASQKSKALTHLRKDISDTTKPVDGALVLNVAVLCCVAVFTNAVEDVKPHFVGLSKLLEINGFAGMPVMLIETQVLKVYLVTEQPFPESVEFPSAPYLSAWSTQKLLARAVSAQPHLLKFNSLFSDVEVRTQLSPEVHGFLQAYTPLFICREHFNSSSDASLSITEADCISIQFCHLLREIYDFTLTMRRPRARNLPDEIASSWNCTDDNTTLHEPSCNMNQNNRSETGHFRTRKGVDHQKSMLTALDRLLSLALVLFFISTTPSSRMVTLGVFWRHRKVLQLKAALEACLDVSPMTGQTPTVHITTRPPRFLLSVFFLGAFLCKRLPAELLQFFLEGIKMSLSHKINEDDTCVTSSRWHGTDGIHEELRKGLYSDRVFAESYQQILRQALTSD